MGARNSEHSVPAARLFIYLYIYLFVCGNFFADRTRLHVLVTREFFARRIVVRAGCRAGSPSLLRRCRARGRSGWESAHANIHGT